MIGLLYRRGLDKKRRFNRQMLHCTVKSYTAGTLIIFRLGFTELSSVTKNGNRARLCFGPGRKGHNIFPNLARYEHFCVIYRHCIQRFVVFISSISLTLVRYSMYMYSKLEPWFSFCQICGYKVCVYKEREIFS